MMSIDELKLCPFECYTENRCSRCLYTLSEGRFYVCRGFQNKIVGRYVRTGFALEEAFYVSRTFIPAPL